MDLDTAIRQVQSKLNRLSLYVLGCLLGKCRAENPLRRQVLAAMSPQLDSPRLGDSESWEAVPSLGNGEWN